MALTPKQERFVNEYIIDLNATAAATRAEYKQPNKQGPRLLVNVGVQAAIQAALARRTERVEITQDMVVNGLHTEAERTGDGASHAARVSAWGLLGKHVGMFKEQIEHSGTVKVQTVRIVRPSEAKPLDAEGFLPERQALNGTHHANNDS